MQNLIFATGRVGFTNSLSENCSALTSPYNVERKVLWGGCGTKRKEAGQGSREKPPRGSVCKQPSGTASATNLSIRAGTSYGLSFTLQP